MATKKPPKRKDVLNPPPKKRQIILDSFKLPGIPKYLKSTFLIGLIPSFISPETIEAKIIIFISITFLIYLFFALYSFVILYINRLSTIRRESANGYLLVALKHCFDNVHEKYQDDQQLDENEFYEIISQFCEALSEFYGYKTQKDIGVCCKLITDKENRSCTVVARNADSSKRYSKSYNDYPHKIQDNTPFRHILSIVESPSRKQDLLYKNYNIRDTYQTGQYHCSSINFILDQSPNSKDEFPLCFNSELIIPIIPPQRDDFHDPRLAGFLCIDVNETNTRIFDLTYEYEMLLGVGHAIFLLGGMLNNVKNDDL